MLSKGLAVVGLLAMLVGALDPLEGAFLIVPGVGVAALGAWLAHSRYTKWLLWSLVMVAFGVAAMLAIPVAGGARRDYVMWWGLVIAPYPLGFLLGLVAAVLRVVEAFRRSAAVVA